MPKTEKNVLTPEELRFLGKLFRLVLRDRSIRKTTFIPEQFLKKFPSRNLSYKVLERCYNQDETIYSDSDLDFDYASASCNTMVSSIKSTATGLDSEEFKFFEELLISQKQQNLKLNNCKFHSEFYTDVKVYENFIKQFPRYSVISIKVLKSMHLKSIPSQIQTIQPAFLF